MADPLATLIIDGARHEAWTDIAITRSIESLTGSFEFTVAARDRTNAPRWALRAGASCSVDVDGERVIEGYVDAYDPSYDEQGYNITLTGRDRSADLVDCSAVARPGSWRNQSIEAIAAELAKPFGIKVVARTSTGDRVKRFALQQGETVLAAIERLCRYRGMLAVTNIEGVVELIRPGAGPIVDELVEGVNILSASATHDARDRFSDYIVKGQASGDSRANGKAVSAVRGDARDPAVGRYRPLLVIGEEQSTVAALRQRAQWEQSTRAGKSQSVQVRVAGWRNRTGALWRPDVRVAVRSSLLSIDAALLVTEVTYRKGEAGTTTEIVATPPEAWTLLPVPEERDASEIRGRA